jgi:hypothetical protein
MNDWWFVMSLLSNINHAILDPESNTLKRQEAILIVS